MNSSTAASPTVACNLSPQLSQQMKLVKKSFLCGLFLFATNFLFVIAKMTPALTVTANILPGFLYAYVLCELSNYRLDWKRVFFILSSGGLYIFVAWIATGYSFFGADIKICFPLGSIIGATVLLTLFHFLIDNKIPLLTGILLTLLLGFISAVPLQFLSDTIDKSVKNYDLRGNLALGSTLLIFPIWQTLFGLTIIKLRPSYRQQAHWQ